MLSKCIISHKNFIIGDVGITQKLKLQNTE